MVRRAALRCSQIPRTRRWACTMLLCHCMLRARPYGTTTEDNETVQFGLDYFGFNAVTPRLDQRCLVGLVYQVWYSNYDDDGLR